MSVVSRKRDFLRHMRELSVYNRLDLFASLPSSVTHYLPMCERALDRIKRAGKLVPQEGQKKETDKDHIGSLIDYYKELQVACPSLMTRLDRDDMERQIGLHDLVEPLTSIGDLVYGNAEHDAMRVTKDDIELTAFMQYIYPRIDEPVLRNQALQSFVDFQDKKTPSALAINILDILQGNVEATKLYYDKTKPGLAKTEEEASAHISKMARIPVEFAESLSVFCDERQQRELWSYMLNKYEQSYIPTGWGETQEMSALLAQMKCRLATLASSEVIYASA